MKYEYMVVYSHDRGNGRIKINRDKEVESYSDVEDMDKVIRDFNGMESVFVTDFKLLRIFQESVNL